MNEPVRARINRVGVFSGTGCLVQLGGVILGAVLFLTLPIIGWVLGPIVFLALMIWGGRLAMNFECSNCRNPVANRRVRICASCGAHFN